MAGFMYIGEVNELGSEQFVWMFGNVVESYKEAAVAVAEQVPFKDVGHLSRAFTEHLESLSKDEKIKVLCLHPDLAGRLADENSLTDESTREQKSAELNTLDAEQKAKMNILNYNYKSKFGFPFVICARENKAKIIMEQLQVRYNNSLEQEINIGINEVKKITTLRILDLVLDY